MHLLPREVRAAVDGRRNRAILPNLFKVGGCYYSVGCQESMKGRGRLAAAMPSCSACSRWGGLVLFGAHTTQSCWSAAAALPWSDCSAFASCRRQFPGVGTDSGNSWSAELRRMHLSNPTQV